MAETDLASLMLNKKTTGPTAGANAQNLLTQPGTGSPYGGGPTPTPVPTGKPATTSQWQTAAPEAPNQQNQQLTAQSTTAAPGQVQAPPLMAAPDPSDPFQGNGVKLPSGQWVPKDHPLAAQAGPAAAGGGAAGQPAVDPNPLGTAFKKSLMERINATAAPTSIAEDPVLAAQSGAFRQAQAREEQRNRSAAMEQFGASGLESSGAAASAQRKLQESRGFNEGQFDADLLGNARKDRMAELQGFLSIAGNTLSNEERNGLERELAQLDAAVKREGIASTAALGNADLRLREQLGMGGLNQNLLSILLNNRTDNDRTGLTAAGMGMNANTQALLAMMNGGG